MISIAPLSSWLRCSFATLSTRGFFLACGDWVRWICFGIGRTPKRLRFFGRSHEMTETGNRSRKSPFHPGYLSSALVKHNLLLSKVALSFTSLDFSSQALAPNDPYTFHDDWDTNRCILRVFNQYISRLQDTCHRSCCGARVRVAKVSKKSTVKFF